MNLFELEILRFINNNLTNTVFDSIFAFISVLGNKGILWIIITLVFLMLKKTRKAGICCALSLIMCLVLGNGILKPIVGRIRPYDFDASLNIIIPLLSDASFPSGHTLAAFAFASSASIYFKKYRYIIYTAAVLMGISRIYLCVHYPTDVLAGVIIGCFLGFVSHKICKRFIKI